MDAAKAGLERSKADLKKAKDDYIRMKRLLAKQSIPKQQYDHAFTFFTSMKASLEQAQAILKQAQAGVQNAPARQIQAKAA